MKGILYTIDQDLCSACDSCRQDCPNGRAIVVRDSRYSINPTECISCGHCAAVCPTGAVLADAKPLPPLQKPDFKAQQVAAFLRGKRSVRQYTPEPVPEELLRELVETASLTATATNAQNWQAAILTGAALETATETALRFFLSALKVLDNPVGRLAARLAGGVSYTRKDALRYFMHELEGYFRGGKDPLFFRAPVVVILSYPKKEGRFGKTDTALAAAHMMLHAESLGLGSCMVGFGKIAAWSQKVRHAYHLPKDHAIGLIFTLGRPAVTYRRLPVRKGMPCAIYT